MALTHHEEQCPEPPAPAAPAPLKPHPARHTRRFVFLLSAIAAVLVVLVVAVGIVAIRGSLPRGTTPAHPGAASATAPSSPGAKEIPYVPGTDDILGALQMLSPTEGWAAGGAYTLRAQHVGAFSCLVLHYSQGQWKRMVPPTDADPGLHEVNLQSIAMISPDEGWAVGSGANSSDSSAAGLFLPDRSHSSFTLPYSGPGGPLPVGQILRYSAGRWTTFSMIPDAELWSVHMLSPTDGWAAGGGGWGTESGPTTSILLHYGGSTWTPVQTPNVAGITSMDMLSATDGWATGTDTILHYDGKQWSVFQQLQGVSGVSMDAATDGWAFGYVNVWHFNGARWVRGLLPSTVNADAEILALSMDSASDGWAVGLGNGGTGQTDATLYLHYTNGQWTQVPGPGTVPLNSVQMLSANEGWAVGVGGAIMHYLNGTWTPSHS